MSSLTLHDLEEAIQGAINAASLWYGTSDALKPGKVLIAEQAIPPFVIIHPDDVSILPSDARHLREYRPTDAEIAERARRWYEERLKQPFEYQAEHPLNRTWWWFRRGM